MLETIIKYGVIFYVMGSLTMVGVTAKLISHFVVRRMVRAAREIQKSDHRLMKLVKAKFEHASMVSNRVQNVEAFVKKYLYEYQAMGCRLVTWRGLPKRMSWWVLVVGMAGMFACYWVKGNGEELFQYGAITCAGTVFLWSLNSLSDEQNKVEATKNYIVDYLENVCIHRYEKANKEVEQAEVVIPPQKEEPDVSETINEREEQEMRIRAILQEFLA